MDKDWEAVIQRYKELIDGGRAPENLEEDMFMLAYDHGVSGYRLLDVHEAIPDDAKVYLPEMYALVIGYALGQAQHLLDQKLKTNKYEH